MRLLLLTAGAAALLSPATASAHYATGESGAGTSATRASNAIAKANQAEGKLQPNSCSAPQAFTVTGPSNVAVLFAGTNAGGHLFAQVTDPAGRAGDESGRYSASSPGTYSYRVCFRSGDGIDSTIEYVAALAISPQ